MNDDTVNDVEAELLAVANGWVIAAILIVLERTGKAIRTPSRDVMLSQASKQVGRGWGFGLHEAMDQTGAVIPGATAEVREIAIEKIRRASTNATGRVKISPDGKTMTTTASGADADGKPMTMKLVYDKQ